MLERLKLSCIINVSFLVYVRGKICFDDLRSEYDYSLGYVYVQSKLVNVFFICELSKRLEDIDILVIVVYFGVVKIELVWYMFFFKFKVVFFIFVFIIWLFFKIFC